MLGVLPSTLKLNFFRRFSYENEIVVNVVGHRVGGRGRSSEHA
jgi:hypothetical protein